MTLNQYFSKGYFINLDKRCDRLREINDEFYRHKIFAERISGIEGRDVGYKDIDMSEDGTLVTGADLGCVQSHLKVVKDARFNGYRDYFVFEDDADFDKDFQEKFSAYIRRVPWDWDMIMFGGNNMEKPQMIDDNVGKISKTYTTHAFAVKSTMYDAMIEGWESKIEKIDITLSKLHKQFNCYIFCPNLVMQRASHSDILNRYNDDWTLAKKA